MSSFKKLSKADVTTVPYAANKRWDLTYTGVINDSNIVFSRGTNEKFNITGSQTTNNQYQSLIYSEINHLFYQSYTSSLNTGSIMFNADTYASASQQRPTSSYFNYNTNPLLIKQFPSGAGETIDVLSINQDLYGSKVLPNSFQISASGLIIRDDGNGNLYEISQALNQAINLNFVTLGYVSTGTLTGNGIFFVGNIFYAHGLAVITDQSYQGRLNPSCTTYIFNTPSRTQTNFDYVPCGQTLYTSVSIRSPQQYCINNNYPVLKTTGPGAATPLSDCSLTYKKKISFQNEHIIYENEVNCIIKESDFNLSYNPTLLKYKGQYITSGSSGYTLTGSFDSTVKDFATGSSFYPYATAIGLYNDENELLMVAKLAKPIMMSPNTDMTFIVKYDT